MVYGLSYTSGLEPQLISSVNPLEKVGSTTVPLYDVSKMRYNERLFIVISSHHWGCKV